MFELILCNSLMIHSTSVLFRSCTIASSAFFSQSVCHPFGPPPSAHSICAICCHKSYEFRFLARLRSIIAPRFVTVSIRSKNSTSRILFTRVPCRSISNSSSVVVVSSPLLQVQVQGPLMSPSLTLLDPVPVPIGCPFAPPSTAPLPLSFEEIDPLPLIFFPNFFEN